MAKTGKRTDRQSGWAGVPRWAKVCSALGVLLMLVSGGVLVGAKALLARYEGAVGTGDLFGDGAGGASGARESDIRGPLNILLVGIDPRKPSTPPLADSIMIAHIPAGLDRAYLFYIPRDTVVDIPRFDKAGVTGGRTKVNAAMAWGSRVPGQPDKPSVPQGFELLSKTLTAYTGIERFDAGAIINFNGFKSVVDAMGGVNMYVDERTKSEHLKPDGSRRPGNPSGEGYVGPQKVYEVGQHHLSGWEALDFVRQRYGLKGTDYGRQRHQQQFLKALADQALSRDVVTNPIKLDKVLRAAGSSLVFNGRGHSVIDFGMALRNITSDSITTVRLPGGGLTVGGSYQGEQLQPVARQFFEAVRTNQVDAFMTAHPELVNQKM